MNAIFTTAARKDVMSWWPWSSRSSRSNDDLASSTIAHAKDELRSARDSVNATLEQAKREANSISSTNWFDRRTAIAFAIGGATTLSARWFAARYLRRVRNVDYIKPELLRRKADLGPLRRWVKTGFLRRRKLLGKVTSVGDGDNFHFFHTPGGRLAGWGWARRVPDARSDLKGETVGLPGAL